MEELLRSLRREIYWLLFAIQREQTRISPEAPVLERVRDLVSTWLIVALPNLQALNVSRDVRDRTDRFFLQLAKLASATSPKQKYVAVLTKLSELMTVEIPRQVAIIPVGIRASVKLPTTENLIPEISDLPNQLLPNALHGWIPEIKQFLSHNEFGRNVFIMVSYRSSLASLVRQVQRALTEANLNPIVARDHGITDDLYNPIACLLCCSYGVAIFDRPETSQQHNPNVVYELGMMQLLKRPCVILKHRQLKKMPSDLLTRLYEAYASNEEAAKRVSDWWKRSNHP